MNDNTITLSCIAGYEEEKEEAKGIIDLFQNFNLYKEKGLSIYKGLLLCGDPGVGKTLFAKAIANESNVPLFEYESGEAVNHEEAVEHLRSLFQKAKEEAPSILFIDELDEIISGTAPGGFRGYQSDFSRRMLKTLLTEIDGLNSSEGVLVIATSNSKKTIPPALIRSGRLEKQIMFRKPLLSDRVEIAKLYLERVNVDPSFAKAIAAKTAGFSGADIKALINESVIISVREKKDLSMKTIERVIPTIRFGEIKKNGNQRAADSVYYHEIGHFLLRYLLFKEVGSIHAEQYGSIQGYMETEESEEKDSQEPLSLDNAFREVTVNLAGLAAEKVFEGEPHLGSESDIKKSEQMILRVFRGGLLGFRNIPVFGEEESPFGSCGFENYAYREEISERICQMLAIAFKRAKNNLIANKELELFIFDKMKTKASLSKEEMEEVLDEFIEKGGVVHLETDIKPLEA